MYSYKDKLNIVIIIDYNEYNTTKGYIANFCMHTKIDANMRGLDS